jgi:magnesium chelatase subunit D
MKSPTQQLPFPALVGLDLAQQALLMLAVEPRLRGVALAATAGTGKSSLARGIQALLDVPFVDVPTSASIENLVGGLDLEATLSAGRMVLRPGLLVRAHGGIAYVDGVNLLQDSTVNTLLTVLDERVVQIEREGVSQRPTADFSLIASYDPEEGVPRRHLLDRMGLLVTLPSSADSEQRQNVIRQNLLGDAAAWEEDTDFLRGVILAAREQLPHVTISDEQIAYLSVTALQYGAEGHRVDLFATHAARASAALAMREAVDDEDLEIAARLVILPRATQIPTPPEPPPEEEDPPPPPPPEPPEDQPEEPENNPDDPEDDPDDPDDSEPEQMALPDDLLLEALASELPEIIEDLPFNKLRKSRSGSRGKTSGQRGRFIRSVPGDMNRARIDIPATLRAAIPWQRIRGTEAGGHIALRKSDVRVKQYQSKAGVLFCLAVDASGSMALNRMRQAKGAVQKLLERAYVNRDQVALIGFRGEQADLLLPPSQSVELAQRELDLLPTGGGTPLASALVMAMTVAEQARRKGVMQTVLVLLTDGRGNVKLKPESDPQDELQQLGTSLAQYNIHAIVVDTKRSFLSRGEARQLAEWLQGDYAYLPNANSEQIADLASDAASSDAF